MSLSRYRNAPKINFGSQYGTFKSMAIIRNAVVRGSLPIVEVVTLTGNQRLDHLAAIYYNDARLWWVLAAASEIGWGLQVPPGTIITVPDINSISGILK